MYLVSYSNFILQGRRGVAVAAPVVWQNALLSYHFMAATIPTLNGFMRGFSTGGMGYTWAAGWEGGSSDNSYKLRSLSKRKVKPGQLRHFPPLSTTLVTSDSRSGLYSFSGAGRRNKESSRNDDQESDLLTSRNLSKIVVRKDWEIS
jgi:hypothetical protein